jgi:hypothetical protein
MKVFNRSKSPKADSPSKRSSKEGRKTPKGSRNWKKVVDTDDENSNHFSDLSNSTDDAEDVDNIDSLDDNSVDCERFERQLRHKHSKACKAMSVSRRNDLPGRFL